MKPAVTVQLRERLVWLAEIPWRGLPQRHHYLVHSLQRQWNVLFVEPPPSLRPPRPTITSVDGIRVAQAMPFSNARLAPIRGAMRHRWLRRLASRVATAQVLTHLRRIGWLSTRQDLVVVCSNVYFGHAIRSIRPRLAVVDICDDPRYLPGEPAWTGELLAQTIAKANILTTPSRVLLDELAKLGTSRAYYLPNGVDLERFDKARPAATKNEPRNVAGYVGYIGPWFDFELVDQVARALADVTFELVGPVAASERGRLGTLLQHKNVHHFPPVPADAVPAVMAGLSVGLIPFRITAFTRAVNPLKLYEYSALDLPIVATPFSPEVSDQAPIIDVHNTSEGFASAIRRRMSAGQHANTRAIAESHSWETIGQQFVELIRGAQTTSTH